MQMRVGVNCLPLLPPQSGELKQPISAQWHTVQCHYAIPTPTVDAAPCVSQPLAADKSPPTLKGKKKHITDSTLKINLTFDAEKIYIRVE